MGLTLAEYVLLLHSVGETRRTQVALQCECAMTGLRPTVTTALGLAVGVALALVAVTAGLAARVARSVVTPPRQRVDDVVILRVNHERETITLGKSADTVVPGNYSLWFDSDRGHARVAEIIDISDDSVTRRLDSVQRGDLRRAHRGRWAGWWYLTPADLGVPFRERGIDTPIGVAPAWHVPPERQSTDWVIQVHGRAVTRAEGLRAVSVFRQAGFHSLLVSYRNDGDAPRSADGRYALGSQEWRDVEAAIVAARAEGARRIVLMGWSMGGAIVLQCVTRSELRHLVSGVVLESPVVDWIRVLHFQAAVAGLPGPVRDGAIALLTSDRGARWMGMAGPIDFEQLDLVARAAELTTPLLILHSVDDGYVPSDGSVALARARPDVVTLEHFAHARHTKQWNYDRPRWERAITTWLRTVDARQAADGD